MLEYGGVNVQNNAGTYPKSNAAAVSRTSGSAAQGWMCGRCGFMNKYDSIYCEKCGIKHITTGISSSAQSWKCKKCGKVNPPYVGTCGCGCDKNGNMT